MKIESIKEVTIIRWGNFTSCWSKSGWKWTFQIYDEGRRFFSGKTSTLALFKRNWHSQYIYSYCRVSKNSLISRYVYGQLFGCWNVAKIQIVIICFLFMLYEVLSLLYISYLSFIKYLQGLRDRLGEGAVVSHFFHHFDFLF